MNIWSGTVFGLAGAGSAVFFAGTPVLLHGVAAQGETMRVVDNATNVDKWKQPANTSETGLGINLMGIKVINGAAAGTCSLLYITTA